MKISSINITIRIKFQQSMDFSISIYSQLCQTLVEENYVVMPLNLYLTSSHFQKKIAILRHDVDRDPKKALRMAELENRYGLRATYYFRYVNTVFNSDIIRSISSLGHEVGYHYETLSKCKGNIDTALAMFEDELKKFREICPVDTVSMHGSPLSPWDNRLLWKYADLNLFNLVGECYLSLNYQNILYFSDTGRTWLPNKNNLRDHVDTTTNISISNSFELIDFLTNNDKICVCILTHPNRWSNGLTEWALSFLSDWLINKGKTIIRLLRK